MKAFILLLALTVTPVVLCIAGQPPTYAWAAWALATAAVLWFVLPGSPEPARGAKPLSPVMRTQER